LSSRRIFIAFENIAVVRDREAAGGEFGEQRLDVAQRGFAGGGIADVTDRSLPGQPADDVILVERARDMTLAAMAVEIAAVEAGDPRRFLAAMLKRVKAERDDGGGGLGAPDAEDAAFLAQFVVPGDGLERVRGQHLGGPRRWSESHWITAI
jgi:hypothetical protein